MNTNLIALMVSVVAQTSSAPSASSGTSMVYRAHLQCPGGEIPFILELKDTVGGLRAWVVNGSERIEFTKATWKDRRMILEIDYYDATIQAISEVGTAADPDRLPDRLRGKWRKASGKDKWSELEFFAGPYRGFRFVPLQNEELKEMSFPPIAGRWAVRFSKSEEPAVGVFKMAEQGQIEGTFLTTTGDYRFLAGSYEYGQLRLSCFDGAHAFLFDAKMAADGTLRGNFWSRDAWHETWTAERDDAAALPDPFTITQWTGGKPLDQLRFPDLDGKLRSLDDPDFKGKARIIEVFGTWCPNCNDAAKLLVAMDQKYRAKGLRIVGLAFELTGDAARDTVQARKFIKANGIEYPVLLAGTNEKSAASAALPILDRLRGYPTTILLREDGTVSSVHTGFSGPATGADYDKLRSEFEKKIEELLAAN